MSAWQPIETAPKDGRVFLAYWGFYPCFVAWVDREPSRTTTRVGPWWRRRSHEEFRPEGGWRVLMPPARGCGWGVHGNFAPFEPTHWWPLPSPPLSAHDTSERSVPARDDLPRPPVFTPVVEASGLGIGSSVARAAVVGCAAKSDSQRDLEGREP